MVGVPHPLPQRLCVLPACVAAGEGPLEGGGGLEGGAASLSPFFRRTPNRESFLLTTYWPREMGV